jgi:hypothetical protein
MRTVVACTLALAACKGGTSKLDEPLKNTGSAAAVAPAGSAADCPPDDELRTRVDTALQASKRYFDALREHSATWSSDCEKVRLDLLSLEAEGDRFVAMMQDMKQWGQSLSAGCREHVQTLGEQNPIAIELEQRSPSLEAKVKPVLEACKDHPGFTEAGRKGLRLLKKKK